MTQKTFLPAAVFTLLSSAAFAQPGATPPALPAAAPAVEPAAPASAPPAPVADRQVAGGCLLGGHAGIDEGDATTAAEMVCAKLRNAGAPADQTYRIRVRKLGRNLYLVAESMRGDQVTDSRELPISNIEETPVAAPRLARALVKGEPIEATETASNAVGGEQRKTKKRGTGQIRGGIGFGGTFMPGANVGGAVISVPVWYETDYLAVGMRGRLGFHEAGLFGLEAGGRVYTSASDTALFAGVGIGAYGMWVNSSTHSGGNGGAVPSAEIGVSLMRSQGVALDFSVRSDFPTFKIDKNNSYLVPLQLSAELKF